jgi:hypothetical protein
VGRSAPSAVALLRTTARRGTTTVLGSCGGGARGAACVGTTIGATTVAAEGRLGPTRRRARSVLADLTQALDVAGKAGEALAGQKAFLPLKRSGRLPGAHRLSVVHPNEATGGNLPGRGGAT